MLNIGAARTIPSQSSIFAISSAMSSFWTQTPSLKQALHSLHGLMVRDATCTFSTVAPAAAAPSRALSHMRSVLPFFLGLQESPSTLGALSSIKPPDRRPGRYSTTGLKLSFEAPHTGHSHDDRSWSNGVPGSTPPSGSPLAGS